MGNGIPAGAVGAFGGVLAYSLICLTLCILVVCLLLSYGEKWSYITMLATFSAISTFASIIQQIHYATSWRFVKIAQYEKAIKSQTIEGAAFQVAAGPTDTVLFTIQFYCYNVMALNVLWWAVKLFCGSWGVRGNFLGIHVDKVAPASKIFAIVWPAMIIGIANIPGILKYAELFFILNYITLFLSLSFGIILLVLILYKYMRTRQLVMGSDSGRRGGWWAPSTEGSTVRSQTLESGTGRSRIISDKRRSIYDRALLIRFTIGFSVLAVFEVAIIVFSIVNSRNMANIIANGAPDFELGGAISDILFFIPGVTSSLLVYAVFGTAKSYKQYTELFLGCCGLRRKIQHRRQSAPGVPRALEFDRLESISNKHSVPITPIVEDEELSHEFQSRVRYFSTLSSESISRTSLISDNPNKQSGIQEPADLPSNLRQQPSEAPSGVMPIGFINSMEMTPSTPALVKK